MINGLLCPGCNQRGTFGLKENNGNMSKGFMKHIIFACSQCDYRISSKTVPESFNSQMIVASEMGPVTVILDFIFTKSLFELNLK